MPSEADAGVGAGGAATGAPGPGSAELPASAAAAGADSAGGYAGRGGSAGGNAGVAAGGSPSGVICTFPAWKAGTSYEAGDKVMFMGKAFEALEANPGYDPLVSTFFWAPFACEPLGVGGSGSGGSATGAGGTVNNNGDCVLEQLLPAGEVTFHEMFVPPWQGHVEKSLYAYGALCQALKTFEFSKFAQSGNLANDRREVAAFFAHVAKETAFLEQTDEAGQASGASDYHGRGAIQLTGQANYQAAGDYLKKALVQNPGLVSTDAVTNWQVALWFWVVHNNPGASGVKNCHEAILAGDFAQTTRIINGGIECPGSQSAQVRAEYFQDNCATLGVSAGSPLVC